MTKLSAFGAQFYIGTQQVETATVVCTTGYITLGGNATVIVTCTGMTGSPITKNVAVLLNDSTDTVATKIRTDLNADSNITALFYVEGSGALVTLRKKLATANISNLNISVANGTCTGIVNDTTSDDITAGVASASIGQIVGITAPGLSLDTEDVTTHDSTGAFEEVVATILRSGEATLDIVYDPGLALHGATSGLLYYYKSKILAAFDCVFYSTYNWTFEGYVVGFEPDAPTDGKLGASVTIKISNQPVLE